ncbi:helix-turn-helix transcriptional regulator [Clostridium butyricum]|uniref:helix-turn-helix transcriptional regulator n=1 Tax=Clostridium butyricum TaxID=1492 RepID=UPI002ABD294E|nr:LuxR C-terminal-related transcriptional regulator [Clostridium butyricum]
MDLFGYKIFLNDYTESDLNEYINSYEDGIRNNISYSIPDKIIYSIAVNLYNDSEKGRRLLDDIIEYCRANSIKTYLVDSLIYMILILSDDLKNSKREVFSYLREAIYYSMDNNYLMPYVLSGDKLLKIIILMKNDESITFTTNERKFVNKLFDIDKIKNNSNKEILSNREKEVLQVLSQGLSNKEIAENLNISLATVKTHIIKIYSKLNVSSRVQAVEKAKKLSLL